MHDNSISDTVFAFVHSYRLAMRTGLNASELGLNYMHVKCLTFIESNKACTANDIVNFFARDKAQIARLVKDMITNAWVIKTDNPEDRRSQLLSLTDEGKRLASLIAETQSNVHQQMQKNLTDQELEDFKRITNTIVNNLNDLNS
jgi:DNA-binding MarR family transcriptional regulator